MKILYIITQADGGGAQKYVLALTKHFGGEIACGDEKTSLFEEARNLQLTTYSLQHLKRNISPLNDLLAIFEIRKLVKNLRPDIVHLNSTKAGFLGSIGAKLAGAKVVFTAHGFRFLEPLSPLSRLFYLWIEKFASFFRDYIITVSDVDKKSALDHNLISPDKITTIHNGSPQIDFLSKDGARVKLNLPQDKFIFGTIANFYKTKGIDILIEAIKIFLFSPPQAARGWPKAGRGRNFENLQFVLIGDGSEFKNLKLKIKNLGLNDFFKLHGSIPNAKALLKAFNAFILPSRKEGFPFVILEAMQAGLPIIATSVGGVPEALGDVGILVQPENPQALAQAINTIMRDSMIAQNLSQKAQDRAKMFTEEKMLEETKKVYEKVVKAKI